MPRQQSVSFIFRKPVRFFSIERVFRQLQPYVQKEFSVTSQVVPEASASPGAILRNLLAMFSNRSDIYHVTGEVHYVSLVLPSRRTVLTIHDCGFLNNGGPLKRALIKWLFLSAPVRHCRIVTAISEQTKQDIIKHVGCPPEKIVVIPNPVNDTIYYAPPAFRAESPRILFIGSTPNKNLERVIEALESIPCQLEIVGTLSPEQVLSLEQHRIQYVRYSGLTDKEMADRYAQTDLVLFPSTLEGFGLPVVEANKAGRPVITSNLSPMKEVAGGSACLVDPYDVGSIRNGVLAVIRDPQYRQQLVDAGLKNVARFAPGNIAPQYLACYHQLTKPGK